MLERSGIERMFGPGELAAFRDQLTREHIELSEDAALATLLGLTGRRRGKLMASWKTGPSKVRLGTHISFDVKGKTARTITARFKSETHNHRIFFSFCKGTP